MRRDLAPFQKKHLMYEMFLECCEFALPLCGLNVALGPWKWGERFLLLLVLPVSY